MNSQDQQKVFDPVPVGCRKVVCFFFVSIPSRTYQATEEILELMAIMEDGVST